MQQTTHGGQVRSCPGCGDTQARPRFVEPPFVVVQCTACSLVYLANPPADDHLYEEYHGNISPGEYSAESPETALRELHAINRQRVGLMQKLVPGGYLLDVGCGRGYFLKTAIAHGYDAAGIDVSEVAAAYARQELGVRADTRSLKDVAAVGGQYDVITMWHVLEHFIDPFDALRDVHRALKSGGLCMIEVPNLHSLKFILSKTKWEGGNHPLYHRTFFAASTLRAALIRSGFRAVRRVRLSYGVPGRSRVYEGVKAGLNLVAMDAFLDFAAWK